jgi:signal transduction histidine kinase
MVALGVGERLVGALLVSYTGGPRRFTDEERRVITSLAHQIAVALEKARLYSELEANLARLQETQAQLMQADKLSALGTLLSGMAHELNNPLSTIRLSVALLKRTAPMGTALAERLAVIDVACARASRIISDLLMFARRQKPERRRVDLNDVIQATLDLQHRQLELNKIRLVSSLDPAPAIWADSHQLQQVLLNLFSNAIHAMKTAHGRGTLTVRSAHRAGEVVVEVQDDGPGIRPEHMGRIFDPFFTTKGTGAGTGLGLSLSIGIVEAHGGRMRVESVPGAGALFTVHLPIGRSTDPETPAPPAAPLPVVAAADVLIIEDEDPLRGLIAEAVRDLGHQVVEATTGQQALERLQERSYDLVMLDLRLPDVEGQVVWQVALAPDRRLAARVVFMTGDIMSVETQTFLDETGRPVLIKPFTIEQVGRAVSEVLAGLPGPR